MKMGRTKCVYLVWGWVLRHRCGEVRWALSVCVVRPPLEKNVVSGPAAG